MVIPIALQSGCRESRRRLHHNRSENEASMEASAILGIPNRFKYGIEFEMNNRRFIPMLVLAALLLTSTGCVYWRLHQFRNQLSSFPDNFRIEHGDPSALIALNPILMPDDPGWLMGLDPSHVEEHEDERLQVYHFEKVRTETMDEEGDFDIVMATRFKESRLTVFEVPHRFEDMLTEEIFTEVFGSMRDGSIERRQQGTGWTWEEHKVLIPSKNDIFRYLGQPQAVDHGIDNTVMTYIYRLKNSETKAGNPLNIDLWMRITTGGDEHRVVRFESYVGRLSILVDFTGPKNEVKIRRL